MKCGLFGITIRVTVTWFLLYGFTILLHYLVVDHYTPDCHLTSDSKSPLVLVLEFEMYFHFLMFLACHQPIGYC